MGLALKGAGVRALIIDDETDICYLLSYILKQKNIEAVSAGSLDETDKILRSDDKFGIVFLDNHLPDGLGVTYIDRLRKRYPESCLIMISAHKLKPDLLPREKSGVDRFIDKPFSRETILKMIDNYQASATSGEILPQNPV